jgi:hypothetical protein
VFFCAGSASGINPAVRFLLIYSSLGYGTCVPTPRIAADSHSPFFIFAFALAYIPCVDLGFQSAVPVMAFTTASFTCWLSPPSSYPQQFPPFHVITGIGCPRFSVACLSALFRCLFTRAFPLPVCPRFSVACLSALFRCLFTRANLFGDLFSPSPPNSRRFDQSSPLSLSNSIPNSCFYGVSLDFGSLKGEIYFGSGYLIFNLWLYLCFFKNRRHMEKGIRKHMRKRI